MNSNYGIFSNYGKHAHRSGGRVKGAYLRVKISARKYNPNPLSFSHGRHSHSGGERKRFPLLPNGE